MRTSPGRSVIPWRHVILRYAVIVSVREMLHARTWLKPQNSRALLGVLGAVAVVKSVGGGTAYLTWLITGRSWWLCPFGRYVRIAPFGYLAPTDLRDALAGVARGESKPGGLRRGKRADQEER
jgi:hypothetical protein